MPVPTYSLEGYIRVTESMLVVNGKVVGFTEVPEWRKATFLTEEGKPKAYPNLATDYVLVAQLYHMHTYRVEWFVVYDRVTMLVMYEMARAFGVEITWLQGPRTNIDLPE